MISLVRRKKNEVEAAMERGRREQESTKEKMLKEWMGVGEKKKPEKADSARVEITHNVKDEGRMGDEVGIFGEGNGRLVGRAVFPPRNLSSGQTFQVTYNAEMLRRW